MLYILPEVPMGCLIYNTKFYDFYVNNNIFCGTFEITSRF